MTTWTTQDTLTFIVLPILTMGVVPVVSYILSKQKEHSKTLVEHGERLTKVETVMSGMSDDVKEVKKETKTQTRMLDRLLGKMGLGLDGLDRTEE